jgi:hypothetical protein
MVQPQKKAAQLALAPPQIERFFFNDAVRWTASLLVATLPVMSLTTEHQYR